VEDEKNGYKEKIIMAFISPPQRIPLLLRIGILIAECKTKKTLMPARLLSWFPKSAVGSAVLESLIARGGRGVSARLLKLIRMQTSFRASCPFCIDMNSFEFQKHDITREEIEALQDLRALEHVASFSAKERTALAFVREITSTPISIRARTVSDLKSFFSERQFVIISSTIAQVNYWTRLIQSLGIQPAGFSASCSYLNLERYNTVHEG
jgi:alkylhydroperoxidase family enzyme